MSDLEPERVDPIDYFVGAALAAMLIWAWELNGLALSPLAFVAVRHGRRNAFGVLAWVMAWAPTYLLAWLYLDVALEEYPERAAMFTAGYVGLAMVAMATAYLIADRGSLRRTFSGMEVRGRALRRGAVYVFLAVMVAGPGLVMTAYAQLLMTPF